MPVKSFRSSSFARVLFLLLVLLLPACGGAQTSHAELAPPTQHTTLGPGDLFQLEIVGEKDLPKEYQVAADGSVTVPYIQTFHVAGLEPQEVAAEVRRRLIEGKILNDPSVVVTVKEYRSKMVNLLGQVQRPGSLPLVPGMTLIQAISQSGGFTSIAHTTRVNLTRTNDGKAKSVVVNAEEIYEGEAPDIPLQPGDRIYVPERVF